jgi:hypothetical protein
MGRFGVPVSSVMGGKRDRWMLLLDEGEDKRLGIHSRTGLFASPWSVHTQARLLG